MKLKDRFLKVHLNAGTQQTMLPVIANGYAHHSHQMQHPAHLHQALYAADPNMLHSVSPATANGIIAPQQRTDRLPVFYIYQ